LLFFLKNCNLNSELVNYGYAFYLKDNEEAIANAAAAAAAAVVTSS
jgi:hypothetical protein